MSQNINQLNRLSTFASHHCGPRPSQSLLTFRLSTFGLLLSFSLLTLQSCGLDVEDPTPPSPPIWVEKSLPEEWPERGIDAHESGGVYLEWESSETDENIAKYYIYRAEYFDLFDSLGDYGQIAGVLRDEAEIKTYVDQSISLDISYHYKLKAEDHSKNVSSFSDSAVYRMMRPIQSYTMIPNSHISELPLDRKLAWQYNYHIMMEGYCITVMNSQDSLIVRVVIAPRDYIGMAESWIVPENISLVDGATYYWRVDMVGYYVNNRETAGSESPWATFVYVAP
jgi:hypothetical protein